MKLGTVLTSLAAATLVVANPALAGTRSASSLPAAGVMVAPGEGRIGSPVDQGENFVGGNMLLTLSLLGFAAAMTLLLSDDDSFDDIDDLPASP